MAGPSASTSALDVKRQPIEVSTASSGAILRSRPSSPALGSPRTAPEPSGNTESELEGYALHKESFTQPQNGRANGFGPGLRSDVSTRAGPPKHLHPLASTVSSGRSTPDALNYFSDERSPLLSVEADRPSTPGLQQREWQRIPHYYNAEPDVATFLSTERGDYIKPPTLRSRLNLFWTQTVAVTISTGFLLLIVIWALLSRGLRYVSLQIRGKQQPRHPRHWDKPERWKHEKLVKDVKYYARNCGYDIEDQTIVTQDGYEMRVHKVIVPSQISKVRADGRGGFPVIIQHGLFQSSGSFVTSEERSMAFWLAEKGGYQVYLGVRTTPHSADAFTEMSYVQSAEQPRSI